MICIGDDLPDLDDLAGDVILHNFQGLMERDASRDEFDHISSLYDGIRIIGLLCSSDSH